MTSKQREFLNLRTLPGQLTGQETAWLLGFLPRAIRALVKAGLLKPLSDQRGRGRRFSSATVQRLALNERWMNKATDVADAARRAKEQERKRQASRPSNSLKSA